VISTRILKKGFQYSALTQNYKNYLLTELRKSFQKELRCSKTAAVEVTFGSKTKYHRNQLGLPKSQINDAMVIASEDQPFDIPNYYVLEKR